MGAPPTGELERAIGAALGAPAKVLRAERVGPWAVMRCTLDPATGGPSSVIVKWVRADPAGMRADPRQLGTEAAALIFLAEIGFSRAPRLIGADLAAGVLVMEDLSPREPLDARLRCAGPEACAAELRDYAAALGELGAATAGKAARYAAVRTAWGQSDPAAPGERGVGPDWPAGRALLEREGLALGAAAERELRAVEAALAEPGPFLALSNGDVQVNNFLAGAGGGRLIDFEAASFRHALTLGVLIRVPGPAFVTVASPLNDELEACFRRALAVGVPEAEDDRLFGEGYGAAALAWALDRLSRFARLDRRPPGDASRLQLIATLDAAAQVARRRRAWPQLSGWCLGAADWLRRRWPDADLDLRSIPAYTPRG
jgi:hypothetical protein